jgi:adenylate cyclase
VNETSTQPSDEGVWDRLRRRKVVQWSVAYIAAAWALLQGLEFLADVYGWPTAFLRVVTLALALGLPIVVTLAWYHGDRGEQRVSSTELSIVAVLFLLGGGVVWYYQRTADTTTTHTSAAAVEKPIPSRDHDLAR